MSGRGQKRPKGVGQERRGGEISGRSGEIGKVGRDHKIGRHRKGLERSGRGQWWDGHTGWEGNTRKRHASHAEFLVLIKRVINFSKGQDCCHFPSDIIAEAAGREATDNRGGLMLRQIYFEQQFKEDPQDSWLHCWFQCQV